MKLREFWQRRRHKKALLNIRMGLLSLGIDVSNLSDEEIERSVQNMSRALGESGIKASEFERAFKRFGEASRKLAGAIGGNK